MTSKPSHEPRLGTCVGPPAPTDGSITIRSARPGDLPALRRLADLDGADGIPAAPLLLAEVDDELRVALSASDGAVIADPFVATSPLVQLLETHARSARGRRVPRLARRLRAAA
jgi:hypothetical protein